MPTRKQTDLGWLRYSGIGAEFGALIAAPTLLGLWADRHFDSSPWGILAGFVLGLAAGFYRLYQTLREAFGPRGEAKEGAEIRDDELDR